MLPSSKVVVVPLPLVVDKLLMMLVMGQALILLALVIRGPALTSAATYAGGTSACMHAYGSAAGSLSATRSLSVTSYGASPTPTAYKGKGGHLSLPL